MSQNYFTSKLLVLPDGANELQVVKNYLDRTFSDVLGKALDTISWVNHDLLAEETNTLKIADVRKLQQELTFARRDERDRVVVVLSLDLASIPAQNALLKIVEEPPEHTHIILSTHSPNNILPTIRSRCVVVPLLDSDSEVDFSNVEKLFTQLSSASIHQAINVAGEYKKRDEAMNIVRELIRYIHHLLTQSPEGSSAPKLRQHLISLLDTNQNLQKNVHVGLTMEQCFLRLSGSIR